MQDLLKEIRDQVDYLKVDVRKDPQTARKYRVQATPTIVILDKSGRLVKTLVGVPTYAELKGAVNEAVK